MEALAGTLEDILTADLQWGAARLESDRSSTSAPDVRGLVLSKALGEQRSWRSCSTGGTDALTAHDALQKAFGDFWIGLTSLHEREALRTDGEADETARRACYSAYRTKTSSESKHLAPFYKKLHNKAKVCSCRHGGGWAVGAGWDVGRRGGSACTGGVGGL